jgi:hypothetical protein
MGVSEQDMCSFAAGLAISGMLPVVHTCVGIRTPNFKCFSSRSTPCSYSNFFKRCFENMFIASVDRLKLIYAGSYAA